MPNPSDTALKIELLIIEDRDYLRVLLHAYLHLSIPDCQIASSTDLEDGLDIVLKYRPRLVLANLHLSNGAASKIPARIHPLLPETDVIFLCDKRSAEEVTVLSALGRCTYVPLEEIHKQLVQMVALSFRKPVL